MLRDIGTYSDDRSPLRSVAGTGAAFGFRRDFSLFQPRTTVTPGYGRSRVILAEVKSMLLVLAPD